MTRYVKPLGLALVAAFAMSATFASVAHGLKAQVEDGGTATVTATQIEHDGTAHHSFVTSVGVVTCKKVLFEGTVTHNSTSLTVTPTYPECDIPAKNDPVTITHNGCNFTFYGGKATAGSTHHFEEVTVDLICPGGVGGVDIHVYENPEAHNNKESKCTYTIPPFTGKHGNTVLNTTVPVVDDVDLTSTIPSIAFERTFGGLFICGPFHQTSTYKGGTTIRAYSDEAHQNQIGISFIE